MRHTDSNAPLTTPSSCESCARRRARQSTQIAHDPCSQLHRHTRLLARRDLPQQRETKVLVLWLGLLRDTAHITKRHIVPTRSTSAALTNRSRAISACTALTRASTCACVRRGKQCATHSTHYHKHVHRADAECDLGDRARAPAHAHSVVTISRTHHAPARRC
jgi:hypothetical protein